MKMMIGGKSRDCDSMWSGLTAVPGIGIAIVDPDGFVAYANSEINRLLRDDFSDSASGRHLRDLFPAEYVAERMEVMREVLMTGRPTLLRHIRGGRRIESMMCRVESDDGEPAVLTVSRQGTTEEDIESYRVVESRFADLGPLEALSRRELEVLALLGEGLQIAEIAQRLYRSPKTVEKHRAAISRKLGVPSRATLARIAHEADLRPQDSRLTRYNLSVRVAENGSVGEKEPPRSLREPSEAVN